MIDELTLIEERILLYIYAYMDNNGGKAPRQQDIALALDVSQAMVMRAIKRLDIHNYVCKTSAWERNLKATAKGRRAIAALKVQEEGV